MPIELPDLDDIDYDDLYNQALAALPSLYPGWTNQNPSDPGITLIELLAWMTDTLIYRTNRIPPENYKVFLQLLNGPMWNPPRSNAELPEAVRSTLTSLQERYRAITPNDYETLATGTFPETEAAKSVEGIERVLCLGECNLDVDPSAPAAGHVSLFALPDTGDTTAPWGQPSQELVEALQAFFADRRLITTRVHVGGPTWVDVGISANLYLREDATLEEVLPAAKAALSAWFHPWTGGADGKGWPFGRDVYTSEVSTVLAQVDGVEFVEAIQLNVGEQEMANAPLRPYELPQVREQNIQLTPYMLYGTLGQRGSRWEKA